MVIARRAPRAVAIPSLDGFTRLWRRRGDQGFVATLLAMTVQKQRDDLRTDPAGTAPRPGPLAAAARARRRTWLISRGLPL